MSLGMNYFEVNLENDYNLENLFNNIAEDIID